MLILYSDSVRRVGGARNKEDIFQCCCGLKTSVNINHTQLLTIHSCRSNLTAGMSSYNPFCHCSYGFSNATVVFDMYCCGLLKAYWVISERERPTLYAIQGAPPLLPIITDTWMEVEGLMVFSLANMANVADWRPHGYLPAAGYVMYWALTLSHTLCSSVFILLV